MEIRSAPLVICLVMWTVGFGALCWAEPASAGELISVSIDGTERASGNNFVDLVEDVLGQDGAFEDLELLTQYDVGVDYLGIRDAIRVDVQNGGALITLRIPSTGFSRVFVGVDADDVEDQVEDFFESEGADVLAEFLEEVNARSPIAVLDGNPRSTTALLARGAFDRFGLGAPRSRGARQGEVARWGRFDLRAEVSGGAIEADDFDSLSVVDAALTFAGDFEPGFGVSFSVLGQYRDYDGTDVYDAGLELGVPVRILAFGPDASIRWIVTPFLQAGAAVAVDLAAGGLMLGGGGVSSLGAEFGNLEVMMANELVYYGGLPIDDIGGFDFDTELDRLILRNGGKVAYRLASRAFVEGGISFTNFVVSDAAVDFYATPFLGAGVAFGPVGLRVGWESDFGDDYEAHIGKGEVSFTF